MALLRAVRPKQWLKNGIVFLAFVFSIREAWRPLAPATWLPLVGHSTLAFLVFCAVSSAGYLVNDIRDIEADRRHPRKRFRPLAAGTLSPRVALAFACVLYAGGLVSGVLLGWQFEAMAVLYTVATLAYSYGLKQMVIIDVMTIAIGFVLRAVAGAVAISVPVSPWLYLCTILGALFLAVTKRRSEIVLLGDDSRSHRRTLDDYTPELLNQMISVVTAATVVAYSLYAVEATSLPGNHAMLATLPFVLYGLFRYLYLAYARGDGGSPEDLVLRDRPLLIDIVLWLLTAAVVLLFFR